MEKLFLVNSEFCDIGFIIVFYHHYFLIIYYYIRNIRINFKNIKVFNIFLYE